jgi:hypothetical protein
VDATKDMAIAASNVVKDNLIPRKFQQIWLSSELYNSPNRHKSLLALLYDLLYIHLKTYLLINLFKIR